MAGYTRQSTFADGDTITAALFNNEYNQLLNAFSNTSGHKHDGTANEGPVIGLIGDAGVVTPLNKVLIDSTNNHIEFWIDVSSTSVQQLYIADGAIIPVTDSDIDLGTTSLRFKDTYTDTVTTTGNVSIGGDLTVTGSATISGNLTFGDADTDSINLAAEIDSDIIPNTDGTYDLGSATKEWQDLYIDGTANIDSLVADTADINGGTIDGATIATSDITVGAGKTLDVSAGTLTLADDQISGDKVEGGTIAATTITTLTSTTGNITTVNSTTTNATTVDSTNLEVTNLKAKDGTAAGSIADSTGVVTLGSSVLTTTDINGGTIDGVTIGGTTAGAVTFTDLSDGTITIAGFADEDNMSSNSATLLPTQQSVKAYVDSQVTAQDLDFQGDTGGALSIDLDSESLTIAGGTGLDTVGSGNTVTVNIDSTVATLTGTQTLTNKTLTTPVISSISNTGTLTLPTSTDTLVGRATTDTLTNKTLTSATLTSPVINTGVSGTAFLDDDTFATATATTLASSESIKAYVDTTVAATNEVVEDTTPQLGGDLDTNGNDILFGDNDKAVFGAGSDLQIYHDGDSSYISHNTTGTDLVIEATSPGDDVILRAADDLNFRVNGNENGIVVIGGGATTLYNSNSPKLATTLTGINVTGSIDADDSISIVGTTDSTITALATTNADAILELFESGVGNVGASIIYDGGDNKLYIKAGNNPPLTRMSVDRDLGDISFYDDTGTSQNLTWDASADTLKFVDNAKATFGAGSDLEVYFDGYVAWFDNQDSVTKDTQIKVADGGYITLKAGNDSMIQAAGNSNVSLYYDGSPKLATTSTGIDVTGTATMDGLTVQGTATTRPTIGNSDVNTSGLTTGLNFEPISNLTNGAKLNVINGLQPTVASAYTAGFEFVTEDHSGGGTFAQTKALTIGASGDISFYDDTGVSQALFWDASAESLGIGTTSPAQALDVVGAIKVSDGILNAGAGGSASIFNEDGTTADFRVESSGNTHMLFVDGGLNRVGIGTNSPNELLTLYKSTAAQAATQYGNLNTGDGSGNGFVVGVESLGNGLVWQRENTYIRFGTNATEAMRIDSSGNVGIGTSSPNSYSGQTALTINSTAVARLDLDISNARQGYVLTESGYLGIFADSGNSLRLGAGGSEAMRIDSSGNLLVGTTSQINLSTFNFDSGSSRGGIFENSATAAHTLQVQNTNASYADLGGGMLYINQSGGASVTGFRAISVYANSIARFAVRGDGTIYSSNTTVQSISDERFKENIKNLETGLSEVMNLKPRRFDWKEGRGTNQKNVAGFIAQEIETVLPDLVDEFKDGLEDNEMYKTVGYTGLIPTLVKAIQEQQAQIEALQSEINLLKGE